MIHSLNRPLALGLVGLAAMACSSDRAIVTEPLATAYNFRFATVGTNIPRGTVTHYQNVPQIRADSIKVRLAGLEELNPAAGVYQVFLGTQTYSFEEPANWIPATGTVRVIRTDTTIVDDDPVAEPDTTEQALVSTFTAGGPRTRVELIVTPTTLGVDPDVYNLVLVTIQPAAATTPGTDTPKPLWARLFDVTGAERNASFTFGNYHPNVANEYRYGVGGRGTISAWGDILIVDDSALALPPKGYYYATAVTRDIETAANVFQLDTIDLGAQKAPFPRRGTSLRDADIDPNLDPVVTEVPPAILAASERVKLSDISAVGDDDQPFLFYRNVLVTLEAKAGVAEISPSTILLAAFPGFLVLPPTD